MGSKEITNSIAFEGLRKTLIDIENGVENADVHYKDLWKSIRKCANVKSRACDIEKEKAKIIYRQEYQQYEGLWPNLYRAATHTNVVHEKNLFETFIDKKGCDFVGLSNLIVWIEGLFRRAVQQRIVYFQLLKGAERLIIVSESFTCICASSRMKI